MLDRKCSADRKSGVAGSRLNINFLERSAFEHFSVCDTIERDATRETEGFFFRARRQLRDVLQQNFFECRLHARREVAMALFNRLFGFACGAKPHFQVVREQSAENRSRACIAPSHFWALDLVREIVEIQPKLHAAIGAHDFAKLIEETRSAIGAEAHHFVFIAEFPEAEILSQGGVVQAKRVRESCSAVWV